MSPDDHAYAPVRASRSAEEGLKTVPSVCPHDCTSTCALEVERLSPSRIGRVRGSMRNDYTAGVICEKVARYAERIHHPDRLMKPLRRTGPKGSRQFAEISWRKNFSPPRRATAARRCGRITTPAPWDL